MQKNPSIHPELRYRMGCLIKHVNKLEKVVELTNDPSTAFLLEKEIEYIKTDIKRIKQFMPT